jgi:parallel beta-helix repeat protein
MTHTHRRRLLLLGYLLLAIVLIIPFATVTAQDEPEQAEPKDVSAYLLQQKESDWRIVRELAGLTAPAEEGLTPTYDALPFTRQADGTVSWLTESYDRYVKVTSTKELTSALKEAKAGDFIHLQDGLYEGNFTIKPSGLENKRIVLYGSRRAVLDGQNMQEGYGLHLTANYWTLFGFTIRNASKGLMADEASHNLIHSLELYKIGDEALHLRRFSSYNRIEKVWIHDVGQVNPIIGEGIYIGSAVSNWPTYTDNQPDRSDYNVVIGNVLGPGLTAEGIDIKEGTQGGTVHNNSFMTDDQLLVDSWVDVKGNHYTVTRNLGLYEAESKFRLPVDILQPVVGWGRDNTVQDNAVFVVEALPTLPFFATDRATASPVPSFTKSAFLLLPARPLPYTLSELAVYFPDALPTVAANTLLVRETIILQSNAVLRITTDDAAQVRLLSSPARFVHITGVLGQITIQGTPEQRLDFVAWDATNAQADQELTDGRAYLLVMGGRMDITYAGFFDLGYEEGTVSGVAWKSIIVDQETMMVYGDVSHSHFIRNYFGAYTFEAVGMHWIGNTFADNIKYGFDPHDFSNEFLFEDNLAYNNGSHGIIFSRGCEGNIIRRNKSYDNKGHGIMLDDGKVDADSKNKRHLVAVPSDNNLVEDNFVVNNLDGIVLEGGKNNIVRNNLVIGPHRYGLRLKDDVSNTQIVSNTIESSTRFGIFAYNNAHHNLFQNNKITYGPGGIALQDSPLNTVTANVISQIRGSAIVLKGDIQGSRIMDNVISGFGADPLRTEAMTGVTLAKVLDSNDFSRWRYLLPVVVPSLLIGTWSAVFLIPIFMTLRRTLYKLWSNRRNVRL